VTVHVDAGIEYWSCREALAECSPHGQTARGAAGPPGRPLRRRTQLVAA
jgi:hypothetical protein